MNALRESRKIKNTQRCSASRRCYDSGNVNNSVEKYTNVGIDYVTKNSIAKPFQVGELTEYGKNLAKSQ